MRVLTALWLGLCLSLSAWADKDTLIVGHTGDYKPLNYVENGELVGIEVDYGKVLADRLGMKLVQRVLPFAELVPALNSGEIDIIMAGMSVTEERAQQVLFTNPVMDVGQMAIILSEQAASFGHPRAMYRPGVRIAVEPNTTGHRYVEDRLPDAKLLFYPDPAAAFAALRSREADIYIHDAPTSWKLASSDEHQDMLGLFRPLTREQLAWAVRKDNTLLASRVNAVLDQLLSTGTIRAVQNHWIPVTVQVR